MRVTIEINHKSELDKLKALFETLNINTVSVVSESDDNHDVATITKGNKRINPGPLFGIWASEPKSLEQIRKVAW